MSQNHPFPQMQIHRYRDERLPKGTRFASESLPCDTFTKPFRISADLLVRSASLRASLRRKERAFPFLYPAFTSQHGRKTRAHAGSTCWATLFRPFRGWLLVAQTIDSS